MCRGADFMLPQSKIRGRNFLESHQFLMLNFCMPEFVLSHFSCVQLFAALWIVAHQALLSVGFSRQEYWTGLPCPPPGNLLNSGIEPRSPGSPDLAGRFFTPEPPGKPSGHLLFPHKRLGSVAQLAPTSPPFISCPSHRQ